MSSITEEQVTEWIDSTERKFRQFNDPSKYGKPPDNPGNGMWREDAKRWANYTPEQKRNMALMNLAPYRPDPRNSAALDRESRDIQDFQHGAGRYRLVKEEVR